MKILLNELCAYAIKEKLIEKEDAIYSLNRITAYLKIDAVEFQETTTDRDIYDIMFDLYNLCLQKNLVENLSFEKLIFEAEIMNVFIDKPSVISNKFYQLYNENIDKAINWFYKLSKSSYYIKQHDIDKNLHFNSNINNQDIEVTINLSKPEKDPKSIALALQQKNNTYPKCALCKENVGYQGNASQAARANHRIIPLKINNEDWYFQYSPYSYYNEHAIVFNSNHSNMSINDNTVKNLLLFCEKFPSYFAGSNADLPIVGGSILTHEHYQAGRYTMPIQKATVRNTFKVNKQKIDYLNWPLSTLRVSGNNLLQVVKTSNIIINAWRGYEDNSLGIVNSLEDNHSTVTPIARINNGVYEVDLILRNNITNETNPYGEFHPHAEYHSIKKENIGLIEAMGLAILPGRLKTELEDVKNYLINGVETDASKKHHYFIKEFKNNFEVNAKTMEKDISDMLCMFFYEILVCCGVFKMNEQGDKGIKKFIDSIG